jgi:copper chaperone CopZ
MLTLDVYTPTLGIGIRGFIMATAQSFQLAGLTCESCTKLSSKRISKIADVQAVTVDLATQQASVTAGRPITTDEVAAALVDTHYTVKV